MLKRGAVLALLLLCCGGWHHGKGANYYVNASTGNDSNSGLSVAQAWKTIGKINSATLVAGTATINLQGSFSDACLSIGLTNAGSVSSLVIQPYGTGYTITANCSGARAAAVSVNKISNVTIKNGTVAGNSGVTQYGILIENTAGGTSPMNNTTVENMTVKGFYCGTGAPPCSGTTADNYGANVIVRRFADTDGPISNVNILSNTLGGTSASSSDDEGVVVDNMSNEEANPAPGGAVPFTQSNLTNVNIVGNLIRFNGGRPNSLLSGNGILINSASSGIIKQNVIHDNGGNTTTCGGNAAVVLAVFTFNFTVSNNSAYNQQPISYTTGCDWDAYDIDVGGINNIVEYNYGSNIFGVCMFGSVGDGNVFRYNIFEGCGRIPSVTNLGVWISNNFVSTLDVYGNTIYSTTGILVGLDDPGTTHGVFANNILYGNGSNQILLHSTTVTGMTVINNDYYQADVSGFRVSWNGVNYTALVTWQGAGGDANGVTTNPSLTSPGGGGACASVAIPNVCPSAYVLQGGSAMIGTGLNLTAGPYNRTVGATDFYGNTIPNGVSTGYNFGADGGNP